jgi:hypothetical protein
VEKGEIMKTDFIKAKRSSYSLVNAFAFAIGIACLFGGSTSNSSISNMLYGIGTSLIASSFVAQITKKYYIDNNEKEKIIEKWGLEEIYEYRAESNNLLNEKIERAKNIDAIVQGGLKNLRKNMNSRLSELLEGKLKIRILIPEAEFGNQENKELLEWYKCLSIRAQKNIEIREYSGLPQELYFRVDDEIVVGPYMIMRDGAQTITYRIKLASKLGNIYDNNFRELWKTAEVKNE